ncbi:hypothetical protein PAXRUDRAFT_824433 [Paxillus rubicundulus Ve08.2h10]|uniref:Uncharacterized protein n=1 Tax=Paxillus rubicundulus Ve08.2h10 TaxID=930991 RepID=A0A0D0DUG5_9AGAM|nr:hypothetical protein PAXRUDRAFT_824433 [Paxillus rubicundulus Ve08.2h10]
MCTISRLCGRLGAPPLQGNEHVVIGDHKIAVNTDSLIERSALSHLLPAPERSIKLNVNDENS